MQSNTKHTFMGGNEISEADKIKKVLDIVHQQSKDRIPRTYQEQKKQVPGYFSQQRLRQHNHIACDDSDPNNLCFVYIPKVVKKYTTIVRCKEDLLQLCKRCPSGILGSDLRDAYIDAKIDLQELVQENQLIRIIRENRKEGDEDYDIYYPIDDTLEGKPFDNDIQQFWHSIELPKTHAELQLKLREMNQDTIKIQQVGPSITAKRKASVKNSKWNIRLTNKHKSEDLRKILSVQYEDN